MKGTEIERIFIICKPVVCLENIETLTSDTPEAPAVSINCVEVLFAGTHPTTQDACYHQSVHAATLRREHCNIDSARAAGISVLKSKASIDSFHFFF